MQSLYSFFFPWNLTFGQNINTNCVLLSGNRAPIHILRNGRYSVFPMSSEYIFLYVLNSFSLSPQTLDNTFLWMLPVTTQQNTCRIKQQLLLELIYILCSVEIHSDIIKVIYYTFPLSLCPCALYLNSEIWSVQSKGSESWHPCPMAGKSYTTDKLLSSTTSP